MDFIAHRGNYQGRDSTRENTQEYMNEAIEAGHHVEVDVQLLNGVLWYGHDNPQAWADEKFLAKREVIVHAKTIECIPPLMHIDAHFFFHDQDDCTLTSNGWVWCYPGKHVQCSKGVWLDLHNKPLPDNIPAIRAICGDDAAIMNRVNINE